MTNINTYKIPFQAYNNEAEYVSPKEVSRESIQKIKARNLKRGSTVFSIFKNNNKLAA